MEASIKRKRGVWDLGHNFAILLFCFIFNPKKDSKKIPRRLFTDGNKFRIQESRIQLATIFKLFLIKSNFISRGLIHKKVIIVNIISRLYRISFLKKLTLSSLKFAN